MKSGKKKPTTKNESLSRRDLKLQRRRDTPSRAEVLELFEGFCFMEKRRRDLVLRFVREWDPITEKIVRVRDLNPKLAAAVEYVLDSAIEQMAAAR